MPISNLALRSGRMPGVTPERLAPAPGKSIGFGVTLADNDSPDEPSGADTFLSANGKARLGLDPSVFSTLIFVEK